MSQSEVAWISLTDQLNVLPSRRHAMLAGYTSSGRPIYKVLCYSDFQFNVIGRNYTAADHFDAHCVFHFLARIEKSLNGDTTFARHFKFLANVHHHALLVTHDQSVPREYFDLSMDERLLRGQAMAKLSKIAFRA